MKLNNLRLATPEEVEKIASQSDLTPTSQVIACGDIVGVRRLATEVDPVFYNDASDRDKVLFIHALKHLFMGNGVNEVYFNVPAGDEKYQHFLESLGAVRTSKEPEFRYKMPINVN